MQLYGLVTLSTRQSVYSHILLLHELSENREKLCLLAYFMHAIF